MNNGTPMITSHSSRASLEISARPWSSARSAVSQDWAAFSFRQRRKLIGLLLLRSSEFVNKRGSRLRVGSKGSPFTSCLIPKKSGRRYVADAKRRFPKRKKQRHP